MKTIFKYELKLVEKQHVTIKGFIEITTIQSQNEKPCLWCVVDTEMKGENEICIEIFGTGIDIPVGMGVARKYISTFQLAIGDFIGHAFHRIN